MTFLQFCGVIAQAVIKGFRAVVEVEWTVCVVVPLVMMWLVSAAWGFSKKGRWTMSRVLIAMAIMAGSAYLSYAELEWYPRVLIWAATGGAETVWQAGWEAIWGFLLVFASGWNVMVAWMYLTDCWHAWPAGRQAVVRAKSLLGRWSKKEPS